MALRPVADTLARLDRLGRYLENGLLLLILLGMVALAVLQIVLREFFDTGIIWLNEAVRILVLWLAVLGAVAAARDNRHIRIDLVSHLLPQRTVTAIRLVVDLFAAVVSAFVAWQLWRYLKLQAELEFTVLDGIDVPSFWANMVAPVGFALLSYRFLVLFCRQLLELASGKPSRGQA